MADNANTLTTLNGITKIRYGEIHDSIPKRGYFLKAVDLDSRKKVGNSFVELIVLTNEGGVTYGGSAGDMYTLNDSVAMGTAPASVTPYEYTVKPQMSYGAAQRAQAEGDTAFARATGLVLGNSMDTLGRVLETSIIHGQSTTGIAQVPQSTGIAADTATTKIAVIPNSQWASLIWAGSENRVVNAYDSNGTIISDSGATDMTVTSIVAGTRRVKLTMTSGLATALATANSSGVVTFFWKGSKTSDMVGIDVIFSNTSSTVFGISAATYSQWQGNPFTIGSGPLTFSQVQGYAGQLSNRGVDDEDMILLTNPLTWVDLANEQSALRLYDESFRAKMAEQGINALRYMSQTGWIQIVSSGFVKGGSAYLFPLSCLARIGSTDREWNLIGQEGEPWTNVPGKNGAEARLYADQAIFCNRPSACAKISGFTNTFGTDS